MEERPHSTESPAGPPAGIPSGPPPGPDPVSGALNIGAFAQAYTKVVSAGEHDKLALWFVDVRNFRSINPKFGFARGNMVLRTVAQCIQRTISHDLPVARLGGDRFVMLSAGMDFDEAKEAFERLCTLLNDEVSAQGINHLMMLCAGVYYLLPQDLTSASHQMPLDHASIAHRNAHEESRSVVLRFTEEDLRRDMRRIAIEQTIDDALAEGQIQVFYQPQVDYSLGEVIGAEALARWHHPDLGWISPMEFIPVLENCGKVHELDLFVWEEACRSVGRWYSVADGNPVPISVNVSRSEMFESDLLDHFLELQMKYDLPKGSLRLEVTESAFVEEADRLYKVIERMRAHDMMVEMDDFGSGLSSLNMLKDVPVDVVKLDMGFMRSAMKEDRGGVVLNSVIRMLQGLDTPIIAEGVETLEQAEMLKNMGCHLMQGFHFSRPMPLADFENFVAANRAVEHARGRIMQESHLEELTSQHTASSYLFNHAIGPTVFFFAAEGVSESILVNDEFYEACGLERNAFGDKRINPIGEIDQASRSTMWRATAEAREHGVAVCRAQVRLTGRWFDGIIRFLGPSVRGDIYSLNIVHSGDLASQHEHIQKVLDLGWDVDMLDAVVPNGFVKCLVGDSLEINFVSSKLYAETGLSESEFVRRFHNTLDELIIPDDRQELTDAIATARRTNTMLKCEVSIHYGYGNERRDVSIVGHVETDSDGLEWLYVLVMMQSDPYVEQMDEHDHGGGTVIPFDYSFDQDVLTIRASSGSVQADDVIMSHFVEGLEALPPYMSKTSAAKVIATLSDLRQHPTAGFSDIKCALGGDAEQRWYHINYTCDTDVDGNAVTMHGYAQDASDQMGSVRWWRRQAEIDQLTGLLNRNAVEQNINLTVRTQGAGMMFMVDLDGFKRVNDELGHLVGDALLRDVAGALNKCFRENDVIGRYGGDEFVAFMAYGRGDQRALAAKRAEAIIRAVKEVNAACSVGVALCNSHEATFYDLLEVADEAMYTSKEQGKGTYTILAM